ncbi:hypothetical protein BSKO_13811 [Bryopsis sp. KO-2023]|nr:hypothetical protein BSKO_13811 [Bryopsis sp. KO-2023]
MGWITVDSGTKLLFNDCLLNSFFVRVFEFGCGRSALCSFHPSRTKIELRMLASGKAGSVFLQSNVQRTSSASRPRSPSLSRANRSSPPVSFTVPFEGRNAVMGAVGATEVESKTVSDSNSPYAGKTAVVVGAGPCGSLAGMLLAERGFNVKIFEKRSDPAKVPMSFHRSIPVVLNSEVSTFLMDLGLEPVYEGSGKKRGLMIFKHSSTMAENGKIKPWNYQSQRGTRLLAERHAVAEGILGLGISKGFPNLEFTFDCGCQGVDVDSKIAMFCGPDGETNRVHYDLLIGADGAGSQVRKTLQELGHLEFTQRSSTRRYISIRDLPAPENPCDDIKAFLSPGLLVFGVLKPLWNGPTGFLFYTTQDGIQGSVGGKLGVFEAIKGREAEWIAGAAPDSIPKEWFPVIVEQIKSGTQSAIGPVTYCSTFIAPDVALLGDAAHASTPSLGLGANRALLDARDLDEALEAAKGDCSEALRIYDEKCRPQVAAIQAIELCNPSAALEGQSLFWTKFFNFYMEFYSTGNRKFPSLIPPSALAQMFASQIPPVEALRRFRRVASILSGTAVALVAAGLTLALKMYPLSV